MKGPIMTTKFNIRFDKDLHMWEARTDWKGMTIYLGMYRPYAAAVKAVQYHDKNSKRLK